MITKRLITPFGYFEVLHNGKSIEFSVEESTYDTYYLEDDTMVHPEGCYDAFIDIVNMKVGDVIIARYSEPGLEYDGGDEHTLNAVAELGSYTIGLGGDDIDDLEALWHYNMNEEGADKNYYRTPRMYPYAHWGITEDRDGFEFRIIDNPEKYLLYSGFKDYPYYSNRTVIMLSLVWSKSSDEYAWEMVSFLTC